MLLSSNFFFLYCLPFRAHVTSPFTSDPCRICLWSSSLLRTPGLHSQRLEEPPHYHMAQHVGSWHKFCNIHGISSGTERSWSSIWLLSKADFLTLLVGTLSSQHSSLTPLKHHCSSFTIAYNQMGGCLSTIASTDKMPYSCFLLVFLLTTVQDLGVVRGDAWSHIAPKREEF